jgi:hypothetical protein
MKIKLSDILNSKTILEKLGSTKFEDGLIIYYLIKNIKNLSNEVDNFEKARISLVEKYGIKKENGISEVTQENKDIFNKEINAIVAEEVEVNIFPINPSKISGFTPFELMPIEWLLEVEKKEDK